VTVARNGDMPALRGRAWSVVAGILLILLGLFLLITSLAFLPGAPLGIALLLIGARVLVAPVAPASRRVYVLGMVVPLLPLPILLVLFVLDPSAKVDAGTIRSAAAFAALLVTPALVTAVAYAKSRPVRG
jgi:hypothetical protein